MLAQLEAIHPKESPDKAIAEDEGMTDAGLTEEEGPSTSSHEGEQAMEGESSRDKGRGPRSMSVDLVPRQSLLNLQAQLERAEEEGKVESKRLLRLRQVFRSKAAEYREAVYSLLGYKLDFLPNGRVRLTSAYATSPEQCFDFESGTGNEGTMELVGAGDASWRQQVDPLLRRWIRERANTPGFFGALTLRSLRARGMMIEEMGEEPLGEELGLEEG